MKVALLHDHLAQDGGAEKVLQVLMEMYPEATIHTLLYDKKIVEKLYKGRTIDTSIIQKLPGGVKHYRWYMPFMPMAVEFFNLNGYDLVISSASAFIKGAITPSSTLHICYCHTPTRYLWDYTHQYINELPYNKYFKKVISLVLNYVRMWDKLAADRVDVYIANSLLVKKRIEKYYRRDSTVIYPAVDINSFYQSNEIGDFYLVGGRLVPYKRFDVVIEAFKLLGMKLKVYGDGVDMDRLKKIANNDPNIEFLGRVDLQVQADLYSRCKAFINPQEEDFGITPVEAMASGRPVIAYRKGGVMETIIEGETGEFFDEQTTESVMKAVKSFNPQKYEPARIRQQALKFSKEKFKEQMSAFIKEKYEEFLKKQ